MKHVAGDIVSLDTSGAGHYIHSYVNVNEPLYFIRYDRGGGDAWVGNGTTMQDRCVCIHPNRVIATNSIYIGGE